MKIAAIAAAFMATTAPATAQRILSSVFPSDLVINGVTKSSDGRTFLPVQPPAPGVGPEIAELKGGKPVAYPDMHRNGWKPGYERPNDFVVAIASTTQRGSR